MTDPGLTDAEKLAALQTYLKVLKGIEDSLRARVTTDLAARRVERVGAYLPDGVKLASVGFSKGRKTAKVTDSAAALAWVQKRHPAAIVTAINPAWLKGLLDAVKAVSEVGELAVDPETGEILEFVEIVQGNPYVTVTTTDEGVDRMSALAHGFTAMLEAATDENGGPSKPQYDPAFADRLENGAYDK